MFFNKLLKIHHLYYNKKINNFRIIFSFFLQNEISMYHFYLKYLYKYFKLKIKIFNDFLQKI